MQRFELVAGASAKFWEVERAGSTVTVRFGRLGTVGRAQEKAFSTAAAAEAYRARLVSEKTGKGYRPVSSVAVAPVAVPPDTTADTTADTDPPVEGPARSSADGSGPGDENRLVLPARWRVAAWPRRDRGRPVVTELPPGLEHDLVRRHAPALVYRLENPSTEPDVRAAGLARLAGADDPFGAAVLLCALRMVDPNRDHATLAPLADDWVRRSGHGFAAAAVAEVAGLGLAGRSRAGHDRVGVVRRPFDDHVPHWFPVAVRVRALLATADAADHAAGVAALRGFRGGGAPEQRAVTSFLVPDRVDWVAADCAEPPAGFVVGRLLGGAAHTAGQVRAVAEAGRLSEAGRDLPLLATLMVGLGAEVAPVLHDWIDGSHQPTDAVRRLLTALAHVPSDEAFRLLLGLAGGRYTQPALLAAVERFPHRAVRLLAEGSGESAELLRVHVLSNPDVARQALPTLSAAAAGRVLSIVDGAAPLPVAPADALPPVLRDPPWLRPRAAGKPPVVAGLAPAPEAAMAWKPGEREAFLARRSEVDDPSTARDLDAEWADLPVIVHAPDHVARARLAAWTPYPRYDLEAAAPVLAARHELHALPALLALAGTKAVREVLPALLPYASGEVALRVAGWFGQKSLQAQASAWLARHPEVAARALVPAAVGRPGAARTRAGRVLRFVVASAGREAVVTAAAVYGPEAVRAVRALLDADPLDVLPATPPAVPTWLDPALLPQIPLRNGAGALPPEAVRHVCTVFAMSTVAEPYAGVAQVVEACDMAGFWWEAFLAWQRLGYPRAAGWVLQALGPAGDDDTARRLTPLVRAWPGEGGHARAVAALDVLAAIGTDVALMHLDGIATGVPFAGLRDRARQKIGEVAESRGLTADELADRLVPDFGLDAGGGLTLDYGPRAFRVGFDERLRPYVVDAAGAKRPRAALPKPAAADDPELATAAAHRFAALKKDVRTTAAAQIRRLERAMVTGREWAGTGFRTLVVAHPLLVHLARRLVWITGDTPFRVAEDGTFADRHDDRFTLADDAAVRVAHPVHLDVKEWAELFADYEIAQPFPQIARGTYALTAAEEAAAGLTRWVGRVVPTTRLLGLERRGWRRGEAEDAGMRSRIELPLGQVTVLVEIDPGIVVGEPAEHPEQTLVEISLEPRGALFGRLGRVAASELVRDLEEVTS